MNHSSPLLQQNGIVRGGRLAPLPLSAEPWLECRCLATQRWVESERMKADSDLLGLGFGCSLCGEIEHILPTSSALRPLLEQIDHFLTL